MLMVNLASNVLALLCEQGKRLDYLLMWFVIIPISYRHCEN